MRWMLSLRLHVIGRGRVADQMVCAILFNARLSLCRAGSERSLNAVVDGASKRISAASGAFWKRFKIFTFGDRRVRGRLALAIVRGAFRLHVRRPGSQPFCLAQFRIPGHVSLSIVAAIESPVLP